MARKFDEIPQTTIAALMRCKSAGVRPMLLTPHHMKVGEYNFWPKRGKIYHDKKGSFETRGVDELISLVRADPETARFCKRPIPSD